MSNCPECGATDNLCQTRFDEFLVLEFTEAGYGAVHHLTVATFMVQHSSRMTREGWIYERQLLREFLIENKALRLIRKQIKDTVDSGKRTFRFRSKTGVPVINKTTWTKTILDVRAENAEIYREEINAWARSVLQDAQQVAIQWNGVEGEKMKTSEIKSIFDYNFWAFDRVWQCISQISDAQFVEEIDYSTGSIRNMIVHVMSGNQVWMSVLRGSELPARLALEDFDTSVKTKAKWDDLQIEFLDHLNFLDQEQLNGPVDWELLSHGLKSRNLRWEILLHLANHATDHRAQILAILHHHFHVATVEQDMILYLAERNQN